MAYISFQPKDYFNTKLYTGNGSTNAITGVGFQPDWVWVKNRTDGSTNHLATDAVRGATKCIFPNLTNAEVTEANALQSFNSDGFTLGSDSSVNTNTKNWVSWNWKANGAGSSNSDGSINTTYTSASTTSGFSISTYTGTGANATVGHGLGVAPKVVIVKDLSSSGAWRMYTEMTGNESQLALDQTSAADSGNTSMWNSTSPTTTTFSIGTHGNVNTSGNSYIAYCFAEKKGFSKFGSYSANNNADGPMIYTGFSPAFVMIKSSNDTRDWCILDNKRPAYNVVNKDLRANETDAESTQDRLDFLSNGFKLRNASGAYNSTGNTYIFMAFAEEPIVSSNGVPAVAR